MSLQVYNEAMRIRRRFLASALAVLAALVGAGWARASWSDFWSRWSQGLGADEESGGSRRSQAVAAVRGAWDKEGAAADSSRRNYSAIDKLDRLDISDEDVASFVREGRLAP